jgi:hypothetical protein
MPDALSVAFRQQVRAWNSSKAASNDLGRGTFRYEGVQAANPPELTVCCLTMYGGVLLADENRTGASAETSCLWWVITGPPEVAAMIDGLK